MNRNKKSKNALLFDFQKNVKKLFDEINKILSGKKGSVRSIFGVSPVVLVYTNFGCAVYRVIYISFWVNCW